MAQPSGPRGKKQAVAGYPTPRTKKPAITRETTEIDHKNLPLLRKYVTEFGQINSRRRSGNAGVTQRLVAQAIKRARHLALLPFVKK